MIQIIKIAGKFDLGFLARLYKPERRTTPFSTDYVWRFHSPHNVGYRFSGIDGRTYYILYSPDYKHREPKGFYDNVRLRKVK